MALDFEGMSSIIGKIYDAAHDETLWPSVLADIAVPLESNGAALMFTNPIRKVVGFVSWNLSEKSIRNYQRYYHSKYQKMQRMLPKKRGRLVIFDDFVDEGTIRTEEIYNDLLKPVEPRYVVAMSVMLAGGGLCICSWHRSLRLGCPKRDVIAIAEALLPHLRRALQVRARIVEAEARNRAVLDTLQRLHQAVVLLDHHGGIVWLNRAAEALLAARDGIGTSRGELICGARGETPELHRLIGIAAEPRFDPADRPGGVMAISRPSTKLPYHVLVTPLPSPALLARTMPGPRAAPVTAVFITDPEDRPTPAAETLARLHALTPAEAKLAAALTGGATLKDYAEEAELSLNYVRWLLKQVEAKTDTHSQVQLMRMLTRHAAA